MEKFALLSVSDKTGIVPFAKALAEEIGFTLLSTGGTASLLRENGIPVLDVSEHTGFPEMMDGRVKTLHPKVHGGLLCLRDEEAHLEAARDHGIKMIDLVVVNLYPFEETVARPSVSFGFATKDFGFDRNEDLLYENGIGYIFLVNMLFSCGWWTFWYLDQPWAYVMSDLMIIGMLVTAVMMM